MHKLQLLWYFFYDCAFGIPIPVHALPQNLSSSALLLVTFNSQAHTHAHTYTYNRTAAQMSSQAMATLSFSSFCFLHQLNAKDTFSFYFMPALSLPLDRCSFFLRFSVVFSLSLSLLSAFVASAADVAVVKTQATVSATGSAPSLPVWMWMLLLFLFYSMDGCPHLYLIEQRAYFCIVL